MSSQTPQQSALELAKARANELIQKIQDDLDSIRTAPVNELEIRINSLNNSFESRKKSAVANVETALQSSDKRIGDLEQSIQAEKDRAATLTSELSTQTEEAKNQLGRVTAELASQKLDHGFTKFDLNKSKSELQEANRMNADLHERLKAVEQRNVDLEADVKTVTQRAATAEDELKAFKSRFKQINDDMTTALASSSAQHPTVAQPVSSSAPSPTKQGNVEGAKDAPQQFGHRTRTQSLEPRVSHPKSNKEFDPLQCESILNSVMDKENWFNRYFLSARRNPSTQDVKLGPMNLGTMKDNLARGVYTSDTSFKADFDGMIADCKKLNPPNSLVCTAAEQLARTFEQTRSAQRISSHVSRDEISQDQESRDHKRKASTEGPVSSEGDHKAKKAREESRVNDDTVRPASSDADDDYPANPAIHRARQSADKSQSPSGVNVPVWRGHLTTGPLINVNVVMDVEAKRVSVVQSVITLNDWKTLLPRDLRVTTHAKMDVVEDDLFRSNFCDWLGTITLCLKPASQSDSSAFKKLSKYLVSKERYAIISHQQRQGTVNKIYLIPALPKTDHPEDVRSLGHRVLPRAQAKNVMFMVIDYYIYSEVRKPVRQAWNDIIQAVHSPDMRDLAGIHDHLMQHPLPIYGQTSMAVFSIMPYFVSMFSDLPSSPAIADTKLLAEYRCSFLNLSYPKLDQSDQTSIDGVKIPEFVFILGRVVERWGSVYELLVVDIQNKDRPLWIIPSHEKDDSRLGTTIGLLTREFPKSLQEWETHIVDNLRDVQSRKQLKDTGLRIKRIGSTHESAMEGNSS